MKDLFEEIRDEYRAMPGYGVKWTFEGDAYACDESVHAVLFGDNREEWTNGTQHNYQYVFLDGKQIGWLHEWLGGRLADPMCVEFVVPLEADEEEAYKNNPHYDDDNEGGYGRMHFANLQDMVDFALSRDEVALTDEQAEMSDLLCDEYGCDRDEANTIVSAYGGWVGEILSI